MGFTSHPQKDLLLIEGLVLLGHELEEISPERSQEAWKIAEAIAATNNLTLEDAALQIDHQWPKTRNR